MAHIRERAEDAKSGKPFFLYLALPAPHTPIVPIDQFRGASELKLDSHNRLLLPKRLMEYAEIENNVILFGYGSKIEVWSEELYNNLLQNEPQDFATLAEEIMGGLSPGESEWQH